MVLALLMSMFTYYMEVIIVNDFIEGKALKCDLEDADLFSPKYPLRKRPIGNVSLKDNVSVGRPKISIPMAKMPKPVVTETASATPAAPNIKRARFEETHRRRTIYFENTLDKKVQQICAYHSTYRSMTQLIEAALLSFIAQQKL